MKIAITSANHSITRSLIEIFVSLTKEMLQGVTLVILTRNMTPSSHLLSRNLRSKVSPDVLSKIQIRLVDYYSIKNIEISFKKALEDIDRLIIVPINYPNLDSPAVLSREASEAEDDNGVEHSPISHANEDETSLLAEKAIADPNKQIAQFDTRQQKHNEIEAAILRVCKNTPHLKHIIYLSSVAAKHGQRLAQISQCRSTFCYQTEKLLEKLFGPAITYEKSSISLRKKNKESDQQNTNNKSSASVMNQTGIMLTNSGNINNSNDINFGSNLDCTNGKFYTILRLGVLLQNLMSYFHGSIKSSSCIRLPAYDNIKTARFVSIDARDVAMALINIVFLTSLIKSESTIANQTLSMANEQWSFQEIAQLYARIIETQVPIYLHPPTEMIGMKDEELNEFKTISLGKQILDNDDADDTNNLLSGRKNKTLERDLEAYVKKFL